jgi:hypothetical protein
MALNTHGRPTCADDASATIGCVAGRIAAAGMLEARTARRRWQTRPS